jgi:hypothetical protein
MANATEMATTTEVATATEVAAATEMGATTAVAAAEVAASTVSAAVTATPRERCAWNGHARDCAHQQELSPSDHGVVSFDELTDRPLR